MSKYEKTRILGLRALQISQGCKILVPIKDETEEGHQAQRGLFTAQDGAGHD